MVNSNLTNGTKLRNVIICLLVLALILFIVDRRYINFITSYPYNKNDTKLASNNKEEVIIEEDDISCNNASIEDINYYLNNSMFDYVLIVCMNTDTNLFENCINTLSSHYLNGLILYIDEASFNNISNLRNETNKNIAINCCVEKYEHKNIDIYMKNSRFFVMINEVINNYKIAVNYKLPILAYSSNNELITHLENHKNDNILLFDENDFGDKLDKLLCNYKIEIVPHKF